jgi:hypothetical protein
MVHLTISTKFSDTLDYCLIIWTTFFGFSNLSQWSKLTVFIVSSSILQFVRSFTPFWWLGEHLNLRRIYEMGATSSIVVVMVAIHNLERNRNTSQWFCKYSWKLGEKIYVYFHASTIAKAHHTPTWSLVSFTLNFTPLLWKIVLSLNFYFKFKY